MSNPAPPVYQPNSVMHPRGPGHMPGRVEEVHPKPKKSWLQNDKLWEKVPLIIVVIVLGAIFFSLVGGIPIKRSDQKWEYTVIFNTDSNADKNLNKSGKNRWEVIWCRRARTPDELKPKWGYECILKRPY